MKQEKMSLLAQIELPLAKRFRKQLIDDGLTYKRWLLNAIHDYLARPAS